MSLYRAYAAERNSGKNHAQIVADGIFGKDADEYSIQYSQEQAIYAEYMNKMECDTERNRGALDVFGGQLKTGG